MDAVALYRAGSERNDVEGLMETLRSEAELIPPLGPPRLPGPERSPNPSGGHLQLEEDLRWTEEAAGDPVLGKGRGPLGVDASRPVGTLPGCRQVFGQTGIGLACEDAGSLRRHRGVV